MSLWAEGKSLVTYEHSDVIDLNEITQIKLVK
jgi:hypothetical protein